MTKPEPFWYEKCGAVLQEVFSERIRQHVKWGENNHRSLPPTKFPTGAVLAAQSRAEEQKARVDAQAESGETNYYDILMEEIFEAKYEATRAQTGMLREELVQCCAVIVQWIEAIDRGDGTY